jgi:hypothetical protein
MDIVETRRENLRRWVAENGTPPKEKSLFSQLKGHGSFGEKVARRIEQKYGMRAGYLDEPGAAVPTQKSMPGELELMMNLTVETAEEMRLLVTYRHANKAGRAIINSSVDAVLGTMREQSRNK